MSEIQRLIAEFEISRQENKLLINYRERENTMSIEVQYELDKYPIEIDINEFNGLNFDERKDIIFDNIDCQILNQIANLLSNAGARMVAECKPNS